MTKPTYISSGKSVDVGSGTSGLNDYVLSGGTLLVQSGGIAIETTISAGGRELVRSGATVTATVVSAGGSQYIAAGATATNDLVFAGGTISDDGALLFTEGAGSAVVLGGIVTGSGTIENSGSGTLVMSAAVGYESIANQGFTGALVIAGGTVELTSYYAAGAFWGTPLSEIRFAAGAQGVLRIDGGDTTMFTPVSGLAAGDAIDFDAIGYSDTASVTVSGDSVTLSANGVFETVTIVGAAADQPFTLTRAADGGTLLSDPHSVTYVSSGVTSVVASGVAVNDVVVLSGGMLVVLPGAIAANTSIQNGGTETVLGSGIGETIGAGGTEIVSAGGVTSGNVVAGGVMILQAGASATGTTVSAGQLDLMDGTASATSVTSGGEVWVLAGTAYGDVVSGGFEQIGGLHAGGAAAVASGSIVEAGGYQAISVGSAVDATIDFGGFQYVALGSAIGTVIEAGGSQTVGAGGTAVDDVVDSWGTVTDGGTLLFTEAGVGSSVPLVGRVIGAGAIVNSGAGKLMLTGDYAGFGGSDPGFTGKIEIAGGTVELTDLVMPFPGSFGFAAGVAGTLLIDVARAENTISGLAQGDTIDLSDVAYLSTLSTRLNPENLLEVENGNYQVGQVQLDPSQDFTGAYFHIGEDLVGGTVITVDGSPCYCRGTLILTDIGEVAVEHLRIGDRLVTHAGAARPIVWIGRRSYGGHFAAGNRDVLPVLIRAGALDDDVPRRDLFVSPLHAIYLDGVLIPAAALVNGMSILQMEAVATIEYFHLELATHDVILAEGAPSETFVDDGSRGMFHNAAEFSTLYPDATQVVARYCAPRLEDGHQVEALRRRLAQRAAPQCDAAPGRPLAGCLDEVGRDRISGWARDEDAPDRPVRLRIVDNGVAIGEIDACLYRADLADAGIGDGHHGFALTVPGGLSPLADHLIQVQRASDGQDIRQSPWHLAAAPPAQGPADLAPPATTVHGRLEVVTRDRVAGWARDTADGDLKTELLILDNGRQVACVLANRYRADLDQAGFGDGRHAFDLAIPGGFSPLARHVIEVRHAGTGADLPGSPAVLEPVTSFDAGLEQIVADAVAALQGAGDQERVLSFMLAQAERLRQLHADTVARRAARVVQRQDRRREGPRHDADAAGPILRALVVDERMPVAARDAGSQAILSHMQMLRQLGYEVTFAAADEIGRPDLVPPPGLTVCGLPLYASVEDVLRRQVGCFDLVYLHRASIASRYLALARQHMPRARIVYSVADLGHVSLARQAAIEARPELHARSHRMRLAECTAAWSADAVITHSPVEAALLRAAVPAARVHCVPWHVPVRRTNVPFRRRHGVAFIGSYGHAPNVDAARWLVGSVMPLVWQVDPAISCLLVGSDMPLALRRLAGPNVLAIGQVADLGGAVFDRARLTVAPLRYGAGIKGKVLDSLAAGVPCVMSETAAEGLCLGPVLQGLVGPDATALAALICRLHRDETLNREAGAAGMAFVRHAFAIRDVEDALREALGLPRSPHAARPGTNSPSSLRGA